MTTDYDYFECDEPSKFDTYFPIIVWVILVSITVFMYFK